MRPKTNQAHLYITGIGQYFGLTDGTLGKQLTKLREEKDSSQVLADCNGEEVGLYYGIKPYLIADPAWEVIYDKSRGGVRHSIFWNQQQAVTTLTRLMYGTQVSLLVAVIAVVVNLVIGIVFGGISGYIGGMVDTVMMRIVDIIAPIPLTLYV